MSQPIILVVAIRKYNIILLYSIYVIENKLNNVEEALAHQEQQIQDLSDMVIRQSDEISPRP